eukprot:6188921-Pleurochrysis_carterae.AAC.2
MVTSHASSAAESTYRLIALMLYLLLCTAHVTCFARVARCCFNQCHCPGSPLCHLSLHPSVHFVRPKTMLCELAPFRSFDALQVLATALELRWWALLRS